MLTSRQQTLLVTSHVDDLVLDRGQRPRRQDELIDVRDGSTVKVQQRLTVAEHLPPKDNTCLRNTLWTTASSRISAAIRRAYASSVLTICTVNRSCRSPPRSNAAERRFPSLMR